MTMINVASVKDRIVVSAESCVSRGAVGKREKIFYMPDHNVAIAIYDHGDRYMDLQEKYSLNNIKNGQSGFNKIGPINVAKKLIECANETLVKSMSTGVVVVGYEDDVPTLCTFVVQGKRKPSGYKNLTGTYDSALLGFNVEPEKDVARVKDAKEDTTIHIFRGNFSMVFATTDGCRAIDRGYKKVEELAQMTEDEAVKYTQNMIEKAIDEFEERAIAEGEKSHIGGPIDTLIFSKDGDAKRVQA